MNENPLVKVELGDFSKTAAVLIEKISDAVGGYFKPYQIVKVAQAEAEAERIRSESQLEITDLHRRAFSRFLAEEAKKQSNIENIIQKALPQLKDDSSPEDVEDEWIINFFDKCRIISDDDMQELWSRVLSEEANSPGAFSRKTINLLADLNKGDAELFMHLCSFNWMIFNIIPLMYNVQDEIYNHQGIEFGTISHLESLGFVQFNNLSNFYQLGLPKKITVFYYGRPLELTFPNDTDNKLNLGKALLTRAGQELAPICGSKPVDGFFEFVLDRWEEESLILNIETEPGE